MNGQVVVANYTRGELLEAFKLVQNKDHWKRSIAQHGITADKLEVVVLAIEFFTGSIARLEYDGLTEEGRPTFYVVASGYYATIGA